MSPSAACLYDPIISSKRDLTPRGVTLFNQKVATCSKLTLIMRCLLGVTNMPRGRRRIAFYMPPQVF